MRLFGCTRNIAFGLFFLLLFAVSGSNAFAKELALETKEISVRKQDNHTVQSKSANTEKASGWINKNGCFYYKKNGKIVKNCVIKIGKYVYGFDRKGRSIRSKSFRYKGSIYDFNAKGHAVLKRIAGYKKTDYYCYEPSSDRFLYAYQDLKLLKKMMDDPKDYNWIGRNIHEKTYQMFVPFTKSNFFDSKGKRLSVSSAKKGMVVRVYFNGTAAEAYPGIFGEVYKILALSD